MNILKTLLTAALAFSSAIAFAAVDVNKATQAELESIKGIGPSMSAKILDARKTGAFKDWTDLQSRVKGVRSGNSAKFSADGLTVNGAAFTATAVADATPRDAKAPKAEKPAKTDAAKK
ncbi:MAG: helix-hairpin-helix domain-containing protein [Rhizobiales bacterium]|nr:helix-hairpin-helix domain-containing protein [Rhizobacter sp.]